MKMRNSQFLALFLCFSFVSGCFSVSNTGTIPFIVIAAGSNTISGIFENRKVEVFNDQTSLDQTLALYVQFAQPYTVDFSTHQVVLTNVGQRNSGGYSVYTEQILEYSDHLKVQTVLTKPGYGCVTTLALTSPFEFIEIQSTKEIVFEQEVITVDCI